MYPRDFGRVSGKDQSRRQAVLEYAASSPMSCSDYSPVCSDAGLRDSLGGLHMRVPST